MIKQFLFRKRQYVHCSFDDVLWMFKDIMEHIDEYNSIFCNPILGWMHEMHQKYGAVFSCYCFYNAWYDFCLSDMTDKFHREFEENAEWLRFGFHGYGFDETGVDRTYENPKDVAVLCRDYELINQHLTRITSEKNIDTILRLSAFKGSEEGLLRLRQYGVMGFLAAENEERESYYLSKEACKRLYQEGRFYDRERKIAFFRTGIRIENEENIENRLEELSKIHAPIIIFTHEWAFMDQGEMCKKNFEKVFRYAERNKLKFGFPA